MPSIRVYLLFALLAAGLTVADTGSDARRDASEFHRRALIDGAPTAGSAYAVSLAAEAVAALEHGGEVRLFDAAGQEIPSLVQSAVSRGEVSDRAVAIFNRAWNEDGTQTLSVELTERKPSSVNQFVFDIENPEYNARVRIETSMDDESWQIVRDGLHLIRHQVETEAIDFRHDVLRIPTSRFRYYRFTLKPTNPLSDEVGSSTEALLEITGVAVREVVPRGSTLSLNAAIERFEDPRDEDPRHHYWKLDLGRENLGVDSVSFTIPETDFARSASLWEWSTERNRRTRQLASTVAFRYGDDVHSEFSNFTTDARVLVLRIDQGDNEPVSVTAARASRPRQQLRFIGPTTAALPLSLYFDPDVARMPEYDLARRLREHEVTRFIELAHGALEPNPGYSEPTPPRSESIPYLLYALVIPLVIGLGWYVARTIQRGSPPEGDPPEK
jgi:hypothetical protein